MGVHRESIGCADRTRDPRQVERLYPMGHWACISSICESKQPLTDGTREERIDQQETINKRTLVQIPGQNPGSQSYSCTKTGPQWKTSQPISEKSSKPYTSNPYKAGKEDTRKQNPLSSTLQQLLHFSFMLAMWYRYWFTFPYFWHIMSIDTTFLD